MTDQDQAPDSGSDTDDDDTKTGQTILVNFPKYFQRCGKNNNWGWIATAVMIGNFFGTGPLESRQNKSWTQSFLANRICNGQNVSGNPDTALNNVFADNPAITNDPAAQTYGMARAMIKQGLPVVIAWLDPRTSKALPGFVVAVYGYAGARWYFGDPSRVAVSENSALPSPAKGVKANLRFFYSRKPPMGTPPT